MLDLLQVFLHILISTQREKFKGEVYKYKIKKKSKHLTLKCYYIQQNLKQQTFQTFPDLVLKC